MTGAEIREARPGDIPGILELQRAAYPVLSTVSRWKPEHLLRHQRNFAAGQFAAEADGTIVGLCSTFITRSEIALRPHTFREITHRGTFDGHDPDGDTLYGAEIMVHPDFRRRGIAKALYKLRFDLVRSMRLRYFAAGGRLPGYAALQDKMTAKAYVDAVVVGERVDRVLTPQMRSGLSVRNVMPGYLEDPKSANYATLLVWENPDWRPRTERVQSARANRNATRRPELRRPDLEQASFHEKLRFATRV